MYMINSSDFTGALTLMIRISGKILLDVTYFSNNYKLLVFLQLVELVLSLWIMLLLPPSLSYLLLPATTMSLRLSHPDYKLTH